MRMGRRSSAGNSKVNVIKEENNMKTTIITIVSIVLTFITLNCAQPTVGARTKPTPAPLADIRIGLVTMGEDKKPAVDVIRLCPVDAGARGAVPAQSELGEVRPTVRFELKPGVFRLYQLCEQTPAVLGE